MTVSTNPRITPGWLLAALALVALIAIGGPSFADPPSGAASDGSREHAEAVGTPSGCPCGACDGDRAGNRKRAGKKQGTCGSGCGANREAGEDGNDLGTCGSGCGGGCGGARGAGKGHGEQAAGMGMGHGNGHGKEADGARMGRGKGHGKQAGHGGKGAGHGQGRGNGMGHGGGGAGASHAADRDLIHELLGAHDAITRRVEPIPGGVETRTTSDDPEVAAWIRSHVESMQGRLAEGFGMRHWDPLFSEIFARHDEIDMQFEALDDGVVVRETSGNPEVAMLIREHAKSVTRFVDHGFDRVHESTPLPEAYTTARGDRGSKDTGQGKRCCEGGGHGTDTGAAEAP